MSLNRLIYYSAVISGWAAFVGWLIAEFVVMGDQGPQGTLDVAIMCGIVGAAIGAGLNVVAGLSNRHWKQLLLRIVPGLIGGGLGGALGGSLGDVMKSIGIPRAVGFMFVGMAIGVVDGAYERSLRKIRNGVIGGAIGGVLGGISLDLMLRSGQSISSRATAFVLLGLFIGALIGFTQVILREAWLKVVDGHGVGRELILSKNVTTLGRADNCPLPFLGPLNRNIDAEHLRIVRLSNGSFVLEDNNSALGTSVNHQSVTGRVPLTDGTLIKFGPNLVQFHERKKSPGSAVAPPTSAAAIPKPPKRPPPPRRPPSAPEGKRRSGSAQPPTEPGKRPLSKPVTDETSQNSGSSGAVKKKRPPPPPPRKR